MFDHILPALAGWLAAHALDQAVIIILAALCHRERGATHSWLGTQGARALFWATPMTLCVWYLRQDVPWEALARVWLAWLLGMVLLPHGAGQGLAGIPWKAPESATGMDRIARPERLGYLWLAGLGRLLAVAWALEPWVPLSAGWSVLGGLAMPAGYLLGLLPPALPWRLRTEQEWGEVLAGGGIGVVVVLGLAA
ncbi:hypothetical protein [Azospirillum picis]|uniref:Uncharacterized protein n=1 Tax=Azospirillum picis TaxID=488438 RepID=A0ABU0MSR3_9PROT|nr:hypothetical protein [Azospirillum picis]MBP2302509.1 hypothetical protein [Azospirillum picis]MDQ0536249.1 hypothetical protein [Azospirillum picis]